MNYDFEGFENRYSAELLQQGKIGKITGIGNSMTPILKSKQPVICVPATGETLTVGELIKELEKFPKDMLVCDDGYANIMRVRKVTWEHTNYPYNLPDTEFLMIY